MKFSLLFEPRDLWIGLFWDRRPVSDPDPAMWHCDEVWGRASRLHLYICLIPTVVLRVVLP